MKMILFAIVLINIGLMPSLGSTWGSYTNGIWTLMYNNMETTVDFVFTTKMSINNNMYSAFAFSKDKRMGDDNVCLCKYMTLSNVSVESYYTMGRNGVQYVDSSNPTIGINKASVNYTNGLLNCTFSREKTIANNSFIFDLNQKYYILTVVGSLSGSSNFFFSN
jgi:hypothetical protein